MRHGALIEQDLSKKYASLFQKMIKLKRYQKICVKYKIEMKNALSSENLEEGHPSQPWLSP